MFCGFIIMCLKYVFIYIARDSVCNVFLKFWKICSHQFSEHCFLPILFMCFFRNSVWHMLDLPVPPACLLISLAVFHLFISESASFWVRASAILNSVIAVLFCSSYWSFQCVYNGRDAPLSCELETILQKVEGLSQHVQRACHVSEDKWIRTNQHWSVCLVYSKKERVFLDI